MPPLAKITLPEPTYIYALPSENLMGHLRVVAWTVDQLMELNGGLEPSSLNTDWRDDGEDGHNGWLTIITWPVVKSR